MFITGRRQKQLDDAAAAIGRNVTPVQGDAGNLADLDRLYDVVRREKGHIDVLFASAGVGEFAPIGEVTEEHFDKTFGLNVRGTLFTVQKALPLIVDGASIIMRAYNRWIADFCRPSGGRLVPIAQLTLLDPAAAAAELERAVRDGCRGAFVAPFTHSRTAHGHSDHDVLFAKACELDVPLGIHPTYEPGWATPVRFKGLGRAAEFFYNVMLRQGVQQAFLSFFALGTLDRFPALRLGVLEAGSGWIGAFLDRMSRRRGSDISAYTAARTTS